jgi:hypothetical protein
MRDDALRALDRRVDMIQGRLAECTREAETSAEMLSRKPPADRRDELEGQLRDATVWDLPMLTSELVKVQREVADLEHVAGYVPEPATLSSAQSRCHAIAASLKRLQGRAVYTRATLALVEDEPDAGPLRLEAERTEQALAAAETALGELERCIAEAEADLLALAASRAPDHEAALRGEGSGMVERRPSWAQPGTGIAIAPGSDAPTPTPKSEASVWSRLVAMLEAWKTREPDEPETSTGLHGVPRFRALSWGSVRRVVSTAYRSLANGVENGPKAG